jgi:hypothetical protein
MITAVQDDSENWHPHLFVLAAVGFGLWGISDIKEQIQQ